MIYIYIIHVLHCLVFEMIVTSLVLFVLFKSFGWCILFHFLFKCTLDPNAMSFEQDVDRVTFYNIKTSNLEANTPSEIYEKCLNLSPSLISNVDITQIKLGHSSFFNSRCMVVSWGLKMDYIPKSHTCS